MGTILGGLRGHDKSRGVGPLGAISPLAGAMVHVPVGHRRGCANGHRTALNGAAGL
jgi:hypothetical protein